MCIFGLISLFTQRKGKVFIILGLLKSLTWLVVLNCLKQKQNTERLLYCTSFCPFDEYTLYNQEMKQEKGIRPVVNKLD